ncbi:hypothetical protein [Sphingomonas sp.]|uniref:hypothetical protein n=1 Tax=Sphingomonas sp. TaxID=28214 RepID=UPI002BAA2813|nr:hypothetical protein [Sphingomonas sp.]HWK36230.1 hypothetical protein [Sphingomonas sp.]
MIALAALMLSMGQVPTPAFSIARTPVFAPASAGRSPPRRRSPTSRVRKWTVEQRICEHRTNGSCVMTAPDLLAPDVAPKRDR